MTLSMRGGYRSKRSYRRILIAGGALLGQWLLCWFPAAALEFTIRTAPPEFVLPQFTGPYTDREASIAPEEYEMAERLRSMLDSGQNALVVKELESFYDIELSPAMLALKGQVYASLQMYEQAERAYLAVLQRQPQLVRVHSDLAQLYLVQDKSEKARQHFAKAVALGANDALVHGQLGYLNLTHHGPFSAISSYQSAMAIEPDNRQWQRGLLAALTQAKMFDAARALLAELLAKRPNESDLWLNSAALALQQEDARAALASVEMAMLLGEDDRHNLATAAKLHLQFGSYDRAIALFDQSVKQRTLDFAAAHEALSWLVQVGMHSKAEALLAAVRPQVADLSSDERSQYHLHSANIAYARDKPEAAVEEFERALRANPTHGEAIVDYARLLAERKQYAEAELMYMRAEGLRDVEKAALLGRAQLYIDMRDYPAALTQLRTVLTRFPEMRDLVSNIETIENIIRTNQAAEASSAAQ